MTFWDCQHCRRLPDHRAKVNRRGDGCREVWICVDSAATVSGVSDEQQEAEAEQVQGSSMTREEMADRLRPGSDYTELPGRHVTINQIVAYNMAYFRKAAGLTQEELARELLGWTAKPWSKAAVSAAERAWDGRRVRQFDADLIFGLAVALRIPISAFFLPPDIDGVNERFLVDAPFTYGEGDVDDDARDAMFYKSMCRRMYDVLLYVLSDPTEDDEPAPERYRQRLNSTLDFYFEDRGSVPKEYFEDLTTEEQLVHKLARARMQYEALRGVIGDTESVIEFLSEKLREIPRDREPVPPPDPARMEAALAASQEFRDARRGVDDAIVERLKKGEPIESIAQEMDVPWVHVQNVRNAMPRANTNRDRRSDSGDRQQSEE